MILISSPLLISLSLSQQNPSFAGGPANFELPFFGSFDGSGNDARWVGGGEPDAADMREEGLRGKSGRGVVLDGAGDNVRLGVFDPEGEGDDENGLGGSDIV